ncbi:MAG TPA: ATP synthase F1 subunit gamma [Candidatus Binataceae bacterium]|nr:ATP synthase F1 subunit gamma [Candidatus Binataceae bacterium]
MATLKAIRRRIASVKSTQQITRAMKLVAAARLRRAQEALINARPYHEAFKRVSDSLLGSAPDALKPPEDAGNVRLLVVVTSDRGLCGGYNTNVIRMAEETMREAAAAGREVQLFAVGRKGFDHFRRIRANVVGDRVNNSPRLATVALARDVAARMLTDFRGGTVAEAGVIYASFRSALSQRPTYEQLLPVAPPQAAAGVSAAPATDYLIEPSAAELVPVVMRGYVEAAIFHALLEAEASEYGAKMTAMESATNNAVDMIARLTLEMNRARQAQITRELMEIVGGAEALRG